MKKMMKAIALVMAMMLLCAPVMAETDMEYVKAKGTLVVGITDFEPMDYKDENGEWIGFDADLAKAFGEYLGVKVELIEIEWGNKIFELDGRTIDCVWNGMTLTPDVMNSMETSKAYCNNAQVVILKAQDVEKYPDAASMAELTFAVEDGSAGEEEIDALGYKKTEVATQADALMEVAGAYSDAAVIDLLMAAAMVGEGTSYPDLVYTVNLNSEEYGVGFRKGSDLAEALNTFLAEYYASGALMELAEVYGVQASIIPQA